jgi:uncharacterized RDD family membrane protein YckC
MIDEQASNDAIYGHYAGFVTRLVAFFIDRFVVAVFIAVVSAVVGFVTQSLQVNQWLGIEGWAGWLVASLLGAFSFLTYFVYDVGCWLLAGQTPGKRLMGLLVVQTDGQRLRLGPAIRRWFGYWLSAILFLGFLWVLVDNRRQALHDKLAGTLVLYAWSDRPDLAAPVPVRERLQRLRREPKAVQRSE